MSVAVPPGATASTFTSTRGAVQVFTAGRRRPDRVPVVLIHGGGYDSSAASWYRAMPELAAGREVWAIDLPGFGGSIDTPPVGGPVALADTVAEVIVGLVERPVVVVGVSMGGDVALNLALTHPHLVAGVIAIAAGGLVPYVRHPVVTFTAWAAAQLPDWIIGPMTRWSSRHTGRVLDAMVTDRQALPREVVTTFMDGAAHPRAAVGYLRYNQATLGPGRMRNDLSARVGSIDVPVLFFHGDRDAFVDLDGSRRAAASHPRSRLVIAPESGHWAQLEAPELFLTETEAFLRRVDADARDDSAAPS